MAPPFLYQLYAASAGLLLPFFSWIEIRKLRAAGFDVLRAHEKLGHASLPRRGSGPLIWFHGASVGESMSVLALIAEMGRQAPQVQFVLTSGTASSAKMIADRLPPRTLHQFAPLDAGGPVRRFLKHWRPDGAVFVESELWPQMLRLTRQSGARLVLVNARLSEASRAAWRRRPKTAAYVLGFFDLILTQNDAMAEAMVEMNAPADRIARGFNLKSLSAPLPQDPAVLAPVRTSLKGRPVWVAASTHKGEEEIVLAAHSRLLEKHRDLVLLLAPRHPERGSDIGAMIADRKMPFATRSRGEMPGAAQVYLADTLGELGNWYALADVIFLGGSLQPVGGHNPFEVALAGSGVLSGPEVQNFQETYDEMTACGAAHIVGNAEELAREVEHLLTDQSARETAARAARDYVRGKSAYLQSLAGRLLRALDLAEDRP